MCSWQSEVNPAPVNWGGCDASPSHESTGSVGPWDVGVGGEGKAF